MMANTMRWCVPGRLPRRRAVVTVPAGQGYPTIKLFALGPDGRLRNCTLHGAPLAAVDILDERVDVREVLRSPVVAGYRKELPEFCEGCIHAESCGGGCGAAAAWTLGSRRLPDPVLWQHVDDDFGAQLARLRSDGKRHLETIAG